MGYGERRVDLGIFWAPAPGLLGFGLGAWPSGVDRLAHGKSAKKRDLPGSMTMEQNEGTGATQDRTIDLMIASDERTRTHARLVRRGCGKAARGPRYGR